MKALFTSILIICSFIAFSQNREMMEKIEAAKIALITERLELSPEQAEKFWPIYREFSLEQRNIRSEFDQIRSNHDPKNASEEENRKMLQRGMKLKEQQLDLEKTYSERMQQVISTRQLMSLRKAEDDFREMLIKRLRNQQRQRQQINENRRNNQNNMEKRRN